MQPELFTEFESGAAETISNARGRSEITEEVAECAAPVDRDRWARLLGSLDRIRDRHGHSAVLTGGALRWLENEKQEGLEKDRHGLVLRTSSLTR